MRYAVVIVVLVFSIASRQAMALDLDIRSSAANILDFSFLLEHSTIDLERNGEVVETNLERIGILTYDVPDSGPHFGLALGYAFSDFTTNNLFQSLDMDGFYIGLSARGFVYESQRLSLMLEGHYIYQSVEGHDNENNTATLSWNEYALSATATYALSGAFRVYAAPEFSDIQATYRERGAISQTVKLDSDNQTGFHAGIRYRLNNREFVSVQYNNAAVQGVVFRFRRLF